MTLARGEIVMRRATLPVVSQRRRATGIVAVVLGAGTIVAGGQIAGLSTLTDPVPASVRVDDVDVTDPGASSTDTVSDVRPITIDELMTGQVDPEQFNRFWQAEVDRIAASPCVSGAAHASQLRAVVGATPPGDTALQDWAPAIEEAHRQHAEFCSEG